MVVKTTSAGIIHLIHIKKPSSTRSTITFSTTPSWKTWFKPKKHDKKLTRYWAKTMEQG